MVGSPGGEFLGFREKPEGGRVCPSNSLQPMGAWKGGEQERAPQMGEGNGQPHASIPIGGQRGVGAVCPPIPFVPWG